tara:strand:- start:3320 stop:5653 length:2334 start_codon:yes stop_codon:yes gene_type:complete
MNEYSTNLDSNLNDNSLDLKKEISYYLFFWPWILAFTILLLGGTYLNLRYADRIYESSAQIQIKNSKADPSSFLTEGSGFNLNRGSNIKNDIAVISSHHILQQVVQQLNLQVKTFTYGSLVGSINRNLQFKSLLPIDIKFKNPEKSLQLEFEVENNKLKIFNDESTFVLSKGEVLDTNIVFIKPEDSLFLADRNFEISNSSLNNAVAELKNSLTISEEFNFGEIVNLTIKGTNIDRNEAILNTLIKVLSDDQVRDKREISEVSIGFIDDRLKKLSESIDTISRNTIDFKSANNIYNPEIQTTKSLENITKGQEISFNFEIQIEVAKAISEKLIDHSNYDILPANIGIDNEGINQLLTSYNDTAIKRKNLLVSATEQSPVIKQLNIQLDNGKEAIINGVNRYIDGLQLSLRRYQQLESKTKGQVSLLPEKENQLRSYARNFKIVEELYVFLLQRKEEASINSISALPNLKILSYGVSNQSPISPNVQSNYILSIVLGILIPLIILYILKSFDTKINTREDLESGLKNVPIVGEVPLVDKVDIDDIRGVTAESTRVIRSSLSFLLNKQKSNVITVTSTTKGEGKSFVAFNLASSYSALGKKVILLGCDLRNPQIHTRIGVDRTSTGISTYLADENYNDIDSLIIKGNSSKKIDIMLSGVIPPNPSELLMSPRMKLLLDHLNNLYDMIIIDSAPLLLVSDTTCLLPISDLVVYVCRAQYSEKQIFPFIKEITSRPNMPSFAMVLNGLIADSKFGYKYRYSYSYKYNYGYSYGYGSDQKKS